MLELNSKRWAELNHAYGDASDLPELIARLHSGDENSLDELFGAMHAKFLSQWLRSATPPPNNGLNLTLSLRSTRAP